MSKKVIIFHQEFYYSGGAEHTVMDVMDLLSKEGYEVEAWAPTVNRKTCFPDRIDQYKIFSLLPEWIRLPRELRIVLACMVFPFFALHFRTADFFYGANQSGPYFAWVASWVCRKPYIVYMPYPQGFLYPRRVDIFFGSRDIHMSMVYQFVLFLLRPAYKLLDRIILKQATVVMTEGMYSYSLFSRIYGRTIVNNPPVNERKNYDSEAVRQSNYILITNRHVPKKMFELALHAYAQTHACKINALSLVITGGETAYTDALKRYAMSLGIYEKVHFLGYMDEAHMNDLYKKSFLYIYPAPEEDFGKGIIEAMSYGTPVIAWDAAGPGGIIENEVTGMLCRPYDYNQMGKCIDRLTSDTTLYKKISTHCHKYTQQSSTIRQNSFREALIKLDGDITLI